MALLQRDYRGKLHGADVGRSEEVAFGNEISKGDG